MTGHHDGPEQQYDPAHQVTAEQGQPFGQQYTNPSSSGAYPVNPAVPGSQPSPAVSGPHQPETSTPGFSSTPYGQQNPASYQHQQVAPYYGGQPPAGYAGQYPPGGQPYQHGQHVGAALSQHQLIKKTKRPPRSGWRKVVFTLSGGLINLGESQLEARRRELAARVNQPLRGCYKIAMLSLKGGVGKTTVTATLGSTFSSLRGDRVIAVDANPDRGTLSQKIPLETTATVRHLLRDVDRIIRYSDVRSYTSQGPSRLEVLASDAEPAVSEAFSEQDYRKTVDKLEHFYNIVLTDCGTGLMHSAMAGVLDLADSLIIVSSGSVDGANSASATIDWLEAHGYLDLVRRSVAVINSVRPKAGKVDLDKVAQHFATRCRAVCRIPFDPHLEEGGEVELDALAPATRMALLELAATVADDFPNETRVHN